MGAALGRKGAPKQAGGVVADTLSDRMRLSDEERRLLVACGAGAGMAAAYGVPVGARCSRWRCCVARSPCASWCRRW
jgi:CIC family chloride channel protein